MYGIESYIAVPLNRRDGTFFGTLCALDPEPAALSEESFEIFSLLASLIAFEIEAEELGREREQELDAVRQTGEDRERFIGMLGHDLRTPLTSIRATAQMVARVAQPRDKVERHLSRIVASVDRMSGLVADLLDFTRTRIGAGMSVRPSDTDLAALCEAGIAEVRDIHPAREIRFRATGETRGAWDAGRLAQLVSNLVANAVQYSPPDTPVDVLARGENGPVTLEVRNEGPPIPPDRLARIFDPFSRREPDRAHDGSSRGLGLGLYIVREIVLAHGGTIEARSSADAGTAFVVSLPRRAPGEGVEPASA